jgi:hypothetical protein
LKLVPGGYPRRFEAAVRPRLQPEPEAPVTEADLALLPGLVGRYLRFAGAVGRPRVRNFRIDFTGTFRTGLKAPWMRFRSRQFNFIDPPARLFLMRGSMAGLRCNCGPEGLH